MRKFKRAQAQNQASIERHLDKNKVLDLSSSDEENESTNEILQRAVNETLSSYQYEGGDSEKALSYLTDVFQSGGAICLICISSVKKTDSIWNCSLCFSFMHLPCIQHWIRDSLTYKHEKGINPLWACPKCRTEYPEDEIPKEYKCFCNKITDPIYQPWNIPHSCGETCGKPLQPLCGHNCVLLCHPGPCPPCPKMVTANCYCEKAPAQTRRCNAKEWSCGNICNKIYSNCPHKCQSECHSGTCPPCSATVEALCHCKNEFSLKQCNESIWECKKKCGKLFSCKIHECEAFCHRPGDCGDCPLAKNRTCPCGKKKYNVSCKQETVPTCGDTCGKILDCQSHYCNMRCHTERCGQCLEVVTKTCRCGSYTKEIACAKEFHCNKKCTQMRLCNRHPCNKKCCDCLLTNNFNVCEKICDTTLNCRKHKCPAPCHSGPCYPCPRTIIIQCRCGNSKITVPCGTKRIKPPHCKKLCKIPPVCHHLKRESHKCHQGACPPCKKICNLTYKQCDHQCPAVCHTKIWIKVQINGATGKPMGPWDTPKEVMQQKTLPCPPCEVPVMVTCLGGHETLPWPCHKAISSSCQRACGQLLKCTNHNCELICHKIGSSNNEGSNCMNCELPCALPRPQGCSHACPRVCHPAPCPSCKQIVRISCHCGINNLYKRCFELTNATAEERDELLKCGNQCPKIYSCGHRCVDNCHSGNCRSSENCNKRVKVTCKCQRIKLSVLCIQVQKNEIKIECDNECRDIKMEKERVRKIELEKKRKEEELRNQREIEKFERKFKPRRKEKEKLMNNDDNIRDNNWSLLKKFISFGILSSIIISFFFYLSEKPWGIFK